LPPEVCLPHKVQGYAHHHRITGIAEETNLLALNAALQEAHGAVQEVVALAWRLEENLGRFRI
jgi:methyl-accepting chemotaxis protein